MDNIVIVRGEKYMIKIIGSLLLIIGSTGVGIFMSQKLSSRKKILEEFLKFILFIENTSQYSLMPVPKIIQKFQADKLVCITRHFTENIKQQYSLQESWLKAITYIPTSWGLTNNDKKLIRNFIYDLNTSDLNSQLSHCKMYKSLTNENLSDSKKNHEKQSKVYTSLGLAFGVILTVILF